MIDLIAHYKTLEQKILAEPSASANFFQRAGHTTLRILYAIIRDIVNGQLTLHAMSLVYTTMLSIVPLLALSFSVLKSLGAHNQLTPYLYNLFEPMGEQGLEIANNMLSFVDNIKVGVLGSVGLGLLIYTVISLVQKIERSFNFIWRVPHLRSLSQRFSNYLSVILVGPVLVASAIGGTATFMSSAIMQNIMAIEPFGSLIVMLTRFMPLFFIVGAFVFVYIFIPNTRVNVKSAIIGGIVGGILWQLSGILFASFVVGSTQYEAIYSSFAVGIVLLIWMYVSWTVLLLGSSVAYYHQHSNHITRQIRIDESAELTEKTGLAIMAHVSDAFDKGRPAVTQESLELRIAVPPVLTRKVSDRLLHAGLLALAGEKGDSLVPARSLDTIRLIDVMQALREDKEGISSRLLDYPGLSEFFESQEVARRDKAGQATILDLIRRSG